MTEADDLYPLDGAAFISAESIEQKEEQSLEKGKTLAAMPMLEDIIARFKEKIDFYNSLDSIPDEVKTDPQKFLIIHNANELTRSNLIAELEWLEGLIDEYTK